MFNNELDLLELRLEHHSQFVDKFIIIESEYTYTGNPKPAYFDLNKDKFKKFKDKILHIVILSKLLTKNAWENEYFQRNYLMEFYNKFREDDLIIYSDCDEIIRDKNILKKAKEKEIYHLQMDLMFYYFNVMFDHAETPKEDYHLNSCFKNKFHMAKIVRKRHLKEFDGNLYRLRQYQICSPDKNYMIENAGWHFSNTGSGENISRKYHSFSHCEEFKEMGYNFDPKIINERKDKLIDPLGRDNVLFKVIDISNLPEYIKRNQERFREYLYV